MRKPRGGQIRANRLIGPRKVLGEGDRRVSAKGRGRTAPYRGRSAASWIWSTPLDASASEGELRSGYALTPSPSHSRNNLSFLQKGGPRKGPSQRTATALFFLILVWGFPIVAAGILFDVDHWVLNQPGRILTAYAIYTPSDGSSSSALRPLGRPPLPRTRSFPTAWPR